MNELIAWLLEQIDHDEQVVLLVGSAFSGDWSEHRRRVVLQCQAWLARGSEPLHINRPSASFSEAAEVILRLLAVPYADRAGYLDVWRPRD
ncbi:MAG TPA: DUF6221 family protein [Acidothermaceae bacterium]